MNTSMTVIVAGHVCLDIYPDMSANPAEQFQKSFAPGRLLFVGPMSFSTGGAVSNVALALHKLGIAAQGMGKIGDDFAGDAVRQIFARHSPEMAEAMIVDPAASTSYTVIISPPGMDRIFLHCPGANDTFGADDVNYDRLTDSRLFHFGYPPLMKLMYSPNGSQLAAIFRRAKATGVTTSLDTAFPDPVSAAGRANWRGILELVLPYVDIFMPSIEEILMMLRLSEYEALQQQAGGGDLLPLITATLLSDLSDELLQLGTKIVGLKLGYRGLYVRTAGQAALAQMGRARPSRPERWADQELWSACFKVNLVGAAGSGDATIAGFLSALLRGLPLEQAVTVAVAVGACNVEAADTLSGIRPWEQTLERIAGGWPKHPLELRAPGWRFEPVQQLWVGQATR
jgi:sugar/nucleoside kinase (ribokinase family)